MRIITCNVNGIRAAKKKGFFQWLSRQRADIVCLQETKAQAHQLMEPDFFPKRFHSHFYVDAERKGYSGVAIYSKYEPLNVIYHLDWPVMDTEGRYVQCDFKDLSVISLYLPSGSSGDARQNIKFDVLDRLADHLIRLKKRRKQMILCGDWNIAHTNIDIKNWKSNQKNSGFLPEERAFMDRVFGDLGFVDAFRVVNQQPDQYTWWSNRANARANNVGWRIDYQVATPEIANLATRARIYKEKWFSDHAPLIIDYDFSISTYLSL